MANPGGTTSALADPRRWAVTLGGLAAYGFGSRLWLPGLDPDAATGLGIPALSADLSVFAVGVRPILFGLAFVEMGRVVLPPVARWVAHLPYDAAAGAEAVRTGLAPAWAPPALAALVIAAIALLVASARTPGGGRSLDIWPPLLGTIVLQALSAFTLLADAASGGMLSPLFDAIPPLIRLLLLIAAQGGLIWLFAVWRGRTRGADARPLGAEILVCSGALFLSLAYGVGGPMSGPWIILCVAAGLGVASGKAQMDGGLSGPTPTA
jgi:hypothetical protein